MKDSPNHIPPNSWALVVLNPGLRMRTWPPSTQPAPDPDDAPPPVMENSREVTSPGWSQHVRNKEPQSRVLSHTGKLIQQWSSSAPLKAFPSCITPDTETSAHLVVHWWWRWLEGSLIHFGAWWTLVWQTQQRPRSAVVQWEPWQMCSVWRNMWHLVVDNTIAYKWHKVIVSGFGKVHKLKFNWFQW